MTEIVREEQEKYLKYTIIRKILIFTLFTVGVILLIRGIMMLLGYPEIFNDGININNIITSVLILTIIGLIISIQELNKKIEDISEKLYAKLKSTHNTLTGGNNK